MRHDVDLFPLQPTYQCAVIKVAVMSIGENYLIFDRGGTTYIGELGRGFKPPVSLYIPIWCVMECPVQLDVEVNICRVLLVLVHNDGWNE